MSEAWDSGGGVAEAPGPAVEASQVQFPVQFVVSNHPFDGSVQQRNGKGRWKEDTIHPSPNLTQVMLVQ